MSFFITLMAGFNRRQTCRRCPGTGSLLMMLDNSSLVDARNSGDCPQSPEKDMKLGCEYEELRVLSTIFAEAEKSVRYTLALPFKTYLCLKQLFVKDFLVHVGISHAFEDLDASIVVNVVQPSTSC